MHSIFAAIEAIAAQRDPARGVSFFRRGGMSGRLSVYFGRRSSYDNALAETIIGLYKTEVIHRRGP